MSNNIIYNGPNDDYGKNYSESGLWAVLKKYASSIGWEALIAILKLFYILYLGKADAKQKAIIIGALGYLILPADVIPDVLPVVGLTDDIGVIMAVLGSMACTNDPDVVAAAEAKAKELLG